MALFRYEENYKYKIIYLFGIKFSIVKKNKDNISSINEKIKEYDVISFDIFDTLLVRPYAKPTDLFLHLEHIYNIKDFAQNRVKAEESARKKHFDKEDITLDQIYDEIESKFAFLKEKEIELEKKVLIVNKNVKKLYDHALELGKKIIITSDMYLPKNIIEEILHKNGYNNYFKLYLSSDILLTKYSSNLYEYIIKDLNINPNNIFHIGDNYQSDFLNPKRFGIRSEFVPKVIDELLLSNSRAKKFLDENYNNLGVSIILGILAIGNSYKEFNYWEKFGFLYGGPAVLAFMLWLQKKSQEDRVDKLLFIARDGFTLQKVFNIINKNEIKTEYIYAPRILWFIITLDYRIHMKYFPVETLESIKSILNYFKNKDEYLKKHTPNINSSEEGNEFIINNIELYKKLANIEYNKYKSYIEQYASKNNKIGVVDTCSFFISSQKTISLFLEKNNVTGYYWYLLDKPFNEYTKLGYKMRAFQDKKEHIFFEWSLMEFFMTSPEPPIKHVIDSKPLYGIPNKYEKKRMKVYGDVSNGIIEFANIANDIFGKLDLFINYMDITNWINILPFTPNKLDKKYIKEIKHAWDLEHKKYIPLVQHWFKKYWEKIYYLFSFIPIFKKVGFIDETRYYLFSIPIIKKINVNNITIYYLFMSIPILKIRGNSYE